MKQFEKYIFLKIGFFTQNMNFAFWIEINSKSYTECVFKIIHQILLMLCKTNDKYERNNLIEFETLFLHY